MKSEPELVRDVADDLPVGVWVARAPGGEYVYSNRTFAEIMGQSGRDDVGVGAYAGPYGIFSSDGAIYPEDQMPFVRALRAREIVIVDDIVIHRHDGQKIPVRAHARPVMNAAQEITHVVILFFDISRETEARRAATELETRLRHGQRMQSIGQLAAGIAHDFNNVLAVIGMLGARLRSDAASGETRAVLDQLDLAVQSGSGLAQQLLLMGGQGRTTNQEVALAELTRSVAQLLSRTLAPAIVVTHQTDGSHAVVNGDASRLEQVVMNLAINARDALEGVGGTVTIRARSQYLDSNDASKLPPLMAGPHVVLEVEDDGPGIPPEIRSRIFEPYFTTRTTGEQRGSGLGLATVYGIVEAHQGAIEVKDLVPHGTLMRVWLPAPPPVRKALIPGSGKVLIVDDEEPLRRVVGASLASLGYDVLAAGDGAEALRLVAQHRGTLGLMLLDLVMPRMDGRATYFAARELDPTLPVILATGTPDAPAVGELSRAGVAMVLAKPYSLPDLSGAIAKARRL